MFSGSDLARAEILFVRGAVTFWAALAGGGFLLGLLLGRLL